METLGSHSAKLTHVVGMHHIRIDYRRGIDFLDWLLGNIDSVIYDE